MVAPPLALVAELTFRCPLQCGYCSNPLSLGRQRDELDTATWQRVVREAAALGVLQMHWTGGEPLLRDDLETLVHEAHEQGLYSNLITSAWSLDRARVRALAHAGLPHVQISLQDSETSRADAIAGLTLHEHKRAMAREVRDAGMALSINIVLHRGNLDFVDEIIAVSSELGAVRLELANVQLHGWALRNRDALLASRAQLDRAWTHVQRVREQYAGRMQILWVLPDYHTGRPKPCVGGWGQRFLTVAPDGRVLPCNGAHELPLVFPRVQDHALEKIWKDDPVFVRYRGDAWMEEPCITCPQRSEDHGGCRCQAYALTGRLDATDPACDRSHEHGLVLRARETAEDVTTRVFRAEELVARARTKRSES